MNPADIQDKANEIYILYIVLVGLAGLVTFFISAWGVWFKISTRRAKDLENIHGKIEEFYGELAKKISGHVKELYEKIEEQRKEQEKLNLEFTKAIQAATTKLETLKT